MKKIILFIFLLTANVVVWSQDEFIDDYDIYEHVDYRDKFKRMDLSHLWRQETNKRPVYGIIGEKHQRLRVKFISVVKSTKDDFTYIVVGKTKVKNNIVSFKGKMKIKKVLILKGKGAKEFTFDEEVVEKLNSRGVVLGTYTFIEPKGQRAAGVFEGKFCMKWFVREKKLNEVVYDSLDDMKDGFSNNGFVGTWKSYRTKKKKRCNWGDWRVPGANADFDFGACCFSPSDAYVKNGWEGFRKASFDNDEDALYRENFHWWE